MINIVLLGIFAVQRSLMARTFFKKWWTRYVPEPVERTTYVLVSSLAVILIFWQWRPIMMGIWNVTGAGATVLWVIFWATPKMTAGHLLFSLAATGYILIAIQEHDLIAGFGDAHRIYRRQISMLIPLPSRS